MTPPLCDATTANLSGRRFGLSIGRSRALPMLTLAYIGLAAVGCLYVVLAAFLGHLGDSGGHDAAGHDPAGDAADGGHDAGHFEGHYGLDGSGHGGAEAHTTVGATFHFP